MRTARGERLRTVSAAVGIDYSQLSKVERGESGCSDELKLRLAEHFGVSVSALFFQPVVDSQSTTTFEVAR